MLFNSGMNNLQQNQNGIVHIKLIILAVALVGLIGITGWRVNNLSSSKKTAEQTESQEELADPAEQAVESAELIEQDAGEQKPSADGTIKKKSSPAPVASEQPKTTAPSSGATTASCSGKGSVLSTDWMLSNSYSTAGKFKAAIDFAGLTSVVNSNNVVVFAPNDYVYDNYLTSDQKAFMEASPDNMRSVIGWHIVKSCVTWAGQTSGATSPMTIQTLNGPVTYTPGSPGKVNNARIAMWDWFTSNGAVHLITNFIAPPAQ